MAKAPLSLVWRASNSCTDPKRVHINRPANQANTAVAKAFGLGSAANVASSPVLTVLSASYKPDDGSVASKRQAGVLLSRLEREDIQPGDTIVVPENLDKYRLTKDIKDWAQILYQLGLAAAGIKVLKN